MRKYFEMIENEDTAYQNFGDAAKVVPGRKFIVVVLKKKKDLNQ